MGIEKALGMIAGPIIGGLFGSRGSSPSQSAPTTQTVKNEIDPRMAAILYGSGKTLKDGAKPTGTDANGRPVYAESDYNPASQGLLSRFQGLLDKPQNQGLQSFGNYNNAYLNNDLPFDMGQLRHVSWALSDSGGKAHQMQAAQGGYTSPFDVAQSAFPFSNQGPHTANANTANVSLINAPGQNGLDLNHAYSDVIYGQLGNNPFLAGSIQKGLNQSNANFQNLKDDMLTSFKQDLLPSIRGDAIVNGQYGGSRQGLAEGKAADSLARNMTRALSQVAQNQTDAAVAAQAQAYGQDRQNQLSALAGLSGQQFNVAGQNAGFQNQTNLSNAQMLNQNNQFNAGVGNNYLSQLLQNNQFNAAALNAANAMQYGGNQQMNMANLNNKQGANQYNAGALFNMDQLNSQNKATGAGLLSNLANQQYGYANNQNDYALNQAGKINNLISPYANLGSTQTSTGTTPVYQNTGANILGGAMAGAQLFKQFGGIFSGTNSGGNQVVADGSQPVFTPYEHSK
ncbi:hypothetical protein [Undibacterium umbellatum]|uniref:Uncharacterized protein n=1 Tax=Undibacterium umbellatum TaxID=2762300 RepID=A0ABR6ZGM6_9BURK|nr:hypothetical protein [Undibacterium umbellatum]MBC3910844.1 hypothetical protein [Undibacterium umbellatum]